jgi:uncharacterized protein YciI
MKPTPVHQRHAVTGVVAICRDVPDGATRRTALGPAHLAYIEGILGDLFVAGPLYDAAGLTPVGSLFCYRTHDLAQARAWLEADPFFTGGVFASVEWFPYLPAAGEWAGGAIWKRPAGTPPRADQR